MRAPLYDSAMRPSCVPRRALAARPARRRARPRAAPARRPARALPGDALRERLAVASATAADRDRAVARALRARGRGGARQPARRGALRLARRSSGSASTRSSEAWGGASLRVLRIPGAAEPRAAHVGLLPPHRGGGRRARCGSTRRDGRRAPPSRASSTQDGVPERRCGRGPGPRRRACSRSGAGPAPRRARGARRCDSSCGDGRERDRVARVWSTADPVSRRAVGLGLASTQAGELIVRYELRYPGWKPGCDGQTEQEDRYRPAARVGSRWPAARSSTAGTASSARRPTRFFRALAPRRRARRSRELVPDAALARAAAARASWPEPACDAGGARHARHGRSRSRPTELPRAAGACRGRSGGARGPRRAGG